MIFVVFRDSGIATMEFPNVQACVPMRRHRGSVWGVCAGCSAKCDGILVEKGESWFLYLR